MRKQDIKVGVIGKDGRTSAIEWCLRSSPRIAEVRILSHWKNEKQEDAARHVVERALGEKVDFVVIGPEEPLAAGIVDQLQAVGIPCIGPTKALAKLESSKAFTRRLVSEHNIPGNPEYRIFSRSDSLAEIEAYIYQLGEYVVKPDGLTGGKGVKVSNSHLFSIRDALDYCVELFDQHPDHPVVIEEKLDGEEFSLQSFCDGTTIRDMVVVQDHKRAYDNDAGPNTGGMGSYSCADHSLPFLRQEHLAMAHEINRMVARALCFPEGGQKYKGILYGGFMVTKKGIRLLEYNARFGDPEALNVLSLLKTDLVDIFEAIIEERLNDLTVDFEKLASVCKYVVPDGYPDNPVRNEPIEIPDVPHGSKNLRRFDAAVERRSDGKWYMTGSRAVAFVGLGKDLKEAQSIAEEAASSVKGKVYHRRDIGTDGLIQHRVEHVSALQGNSVVSRIA